MTKGSLGDTAPTAKALFNDAQLFLIRPAPTAPRIGDREDLYVSLRRRPSDLGFDPMVSPTLCPTLSTALKSKFFPLPMVIAAGIGQMMTNCALWRKALSATDKRQQQRVGMAFAGRC